MKILLSGSLDIHIGGPALSTYLTIKGLRDLSVDAQIVMYELSSDGKLVGNDIPYFFAPRPWDNTFAYSPALKSVIRSCGNFDIYHAQGIWQYSTYAIIDIAKKRHKPYLITPHGMLYPQDIRKSNEFFKILSLKLRLLNDFNNSACIQVTCKEEMEHCRKLGITSPIAIVTNPQEIKEYKEKKKDNIFRLGYIGRLHPRKNVEGLIYAFATLGEKANAAELLIIGGGETQYEDFLHSEVRRLNLKNVRFTGFLSGKEKDEAIASLSVLAMPSEYENHGIVVMEALIRGVPCIATTGSPWEELNINKCGWWIPFTQEDITAAVGKALSTPQKELELMGERGKKLIQINYSVESVATKMKQLYEWVLQEKNKSDFIYL